MFKNIINNNILLTHKEAANFLGISPSTLANWRSGKKHVIPFIKVGSLVKYHLKDLQEFIGKY